MPRTCRMGGVCMSERLHSESFSGDRAVKHKHERCLSFCCGLGCTQHHTLMYTSILNTMYNFKNRFLKWYTEVRIYVKNICEWNIYVISRCISYESLHFHFILSILRTRVRNRFMMIGSVPLTESRSLTGTSWPDELQWLPINYHLGILRDIGQCAPRISLGY